MYIFEENDFKETFEILSRLKNENFDIEKRVIEKYEKTDLDFEKKLHFVDRQNVFIELDIKSSEWWNVMHNSMDSLKILKYFDFMAFVWSALIEILELKVICRSKMKDLFLFTLEKIFYYATVKSQRLWELNIKLTIKHR